MGGLILGFGLWVCTLIQPAAAAEATVIPMHGVLRPGTVAELVVVLADEAQPYVGVAPSLRATHGTILSEARALGQGWYSVRYQAPAADKGQDLLRLDLGVEVVEATVEIGAAEAPGLRILGSPRGLIGQSDPVLLEVEATEPGLSAGALQVEASEGEVVGLFEQEGKIQVAWKPGAERFPRAVLLGVRDGRTPHRPPAWAVVRLRARPRIPVRTEAGTEVTVSLGGRDYGPTVAGADGVASISVEVRPGEQVAEVSLRDPAGNRHKSELVLGGDPRPTLTVMAAGQQLPGMPPPPVHVAAAGPDGRPWRGQAPRCATSLGQDARLIETGPGLYWAALPWGDDTQFDTRLECSLGMQAQDGARIPVEDSLPDRLVIRAVPGELQSERPIAQVRAWLEDRVGDRLPAKEIQIFAEHGTLEADGEPGGDAIRLRYDGASAVIHGRDTLRATWRRQTGAGPVAWLQPSIRWSEDGEARVAVRALDQRLRPLAGISVARESEGGTSVAITGDSGWTPTWSAVPAAGAPVRTQVRVGAVQQALVLQAGRTWGPEAREADLVAQSVLPIRSGIVRGVFLSTEPHTLVSGGQETARVHLRLVDANDQPVAAPDLVLTASVGEISTPRQRPDGSWEATYRPPSGFPYGSVRISASSASDGFPAAATALEIVPRAVRQAPGLSAGYLVGRRGFASPWVGAEVDLRLPIGEDRWLGRVTVGVYGEQALITDASTADEIVVDLDLLPVSLGLVSRETRGRFSGWLGAHVTVAPYLLSSRFGDSAGSKGLGVAGPGVGLTTGVGLRARGGEPQLQVGYEFLTMDGADVGWEGPIGGLLVRAGYKLIY